MIVDDSFICLFLPSTGSHCIFSSQVGDFSDMLSLHELRCEPSICFPISRQHGRPPDGHTGLEAVRHGLNLKFPPQTHVVDVCFPVDGTILGRAVEPFGLWTSLTEVGR